MVAVITDADMVRLLSYARSMCILLDAKGLMVPNRSVDAYAEARKESLFWREWAFTKIHKLEQ